MFCVSCINVNTRKKGKNLPEPIFKISCNRYHEILVRNDSVYLKYKFNDKIVESWQLVNDRDITQGAMLKNQGCNYKFFNFNDKKISCLESFSELGISKPVKDSFYVQNFDRYFDRYSVLVNNHRLVKKIQFDYTPTGRGGHSVRKSTINFLGKNDSLVKSILAPNYVGAYINSFNVTSEYFIVLSQDLFDKNSHTAFLYFFKIEDFLNLK